MDNKQLKIAVFHNLPSGGAKRSLYNYVNFLTSNNHIVDVFIPTTANEEYLPLKNVATNVIEFEVKKSFIRDSLFSFFSYIPAIINKESVSNVMKSEKKIAKILNESDYDIVYCEQDQFTMTPVILKYLEKPTVYYCQQPVRNDKIIEVVNNKKEKVGFFNNFIIRPFAQSYVEYVENKDFQRDLEFSKYATHILANSYFSHESILRQYGKNSQVSHIGVDTNIFKPLNLTRENYVLSVGTCIPPKGFDFVIESIGLIDENLRPKLIIVGNSSDQLWIEYLKNLANTNGVDLKILTKISDESLLKLYNKAKLVVYAPYLEPFGYVPLEAMACGTPVVGIKEGGLKESIIHNKTGILTQRDKSKFAKAILTLLEDESLYKIYSDTAIEYINSYWTLDHAGKRLLEHLYRILKYEENM